MSLHHIVSFLQQKEIQGYLQNHAINHISIAGSFSEGKETEKSDIDLIVDVDETKIGTDFFSLPRFLEEKLGRKIDLIDRAYINKHIKPFILKNLVKVW